MNNPILTLPDLDDEAVVKLNDFLYELLEAFEAHYCHQMRRYHRDLRIERMQNGLEVQRMKNELENSFDDDELSF